MDHAVLAQREGRFDGVVHLLRNLVGGRQLEGAIHRDLHIHVYFVSKEPGLQIVDIFHPRDSKGRPADVLLRLCGTAVIHHLVETVSEDIIGRLEDAQADDDAGHGIHDRVPQPGEQDPREGAHGGERVRAVMPGLRHQGAGIDFLRRAPGVPEHPLLYGNGNHGGGQGQPARNQQRLVPARCDFLYAGAPDAYADGGQNHGQEDRRDTLHPLVAVGVVVVRLFPREPDSDNDNKAGQHIGCRMHRVRNHGAGFSNRARDQLGDRKGQVHADADSRDLHCQIGCLVPAGQLLLLRIFLHVRILLRSIC